MRSPPGGEGRALVLLALVAGGLLAATIVGSVDRRPAGRVIPAVAVADDGAVGIRLDPNQATVAELRLLPGIGPVLAARIVEDRRVRGRFASLDDLDRVRGIGPVRLAALRPHLRLGPEG